MDTAADGLLALSNLAAVTAERVDLQDDDRSSSLSELDEAPEIPELEDAPAIETAEQESEAETERIDGSPDKLKKKPFDTSPSKLVQTASANERPEIEALTDSAVSSPISPLEDSAGEESEIEGVEGDASNLVTPAFSNKRKRLSDIYDTEDQQRARRRRTGSLDSEKDGAESEEDEIPGQASREPTIEPIDDVIDTVQSDNEDEEQERVQPQDQEPISASDESKGRKSIVPSRSTRRRGKEPIDPEPNDLEDESEADEGDEDADVDDAEVQAKSEEEQAKRAAAMEALTQLEKHFATLRDRLYDERIANLNHELAQLNQPEIVHPELLRQVDCVRKHRDEKFEVEQKLLVYKVGALKRKSVAERAQIHSAYFQTVRDIREKCLERISEQFYRIQRDRFKSNSIAASYAVPFPERRSTQITQQTAYNKEVSILSGFAKYKGFPAAPDLPASHQKELEEDIEKMGISPMPARARSSLHQSITADQAISARQAGEQFLEQTPWANPLHPMNKLGMNRAASSKSPFNDSYLVTPGNQQRNSDVQAPIGSASTIPEHPSQPPSSNFNTPHDQPSSQSKTDQPPNGVHLHYRLQSRSPTETRRMLGAALNRQRPASHPGDETGAQASSPLTAKARLLGSPKRTSSAQPDKVNRKDANSPFPSSSMGSGLSNSGGGVVAHSAFSVR